eukprot:4840723-Pyramimonas_sp.AAC.1
MHIQGTDSKRLGNSKPLSPRHSLGAARQRTETSPNRGPTRAQLDHGPSTPSEFGAAAAAQPRP